jgi:hypothetical protein
MPLWAAAIRPNPVRDRFTPVEGPSHALNGIRLRFKRTGAVYRGMLQGKDRHVSVPSPRELQLPLFPKRQSLLLLIECTGAASAASVWQVLIASGGETSMTTRLLFVLTILLSAAPQLCGSTIAAKPWNAEEAENQG